MANIYLIFNGARRSVSKHLTLADLSENEIQQMTRFPRHAVSELCEMMEDELSRNTARSHAIPVETQLLAALQFFASGSFSGWSDGAVVCLSQQSVTVSTT